MYVRSVAPHHLSFRRVIPVNFRIPTATMKNLYCISGLGADERIFCKLSIKGIRLIHLPWMPFDKNDELPGYAQKMAAMVDEEEPMMLGLSFGGMLVTEIARSRKLKRAFLVSSAKGKHELPQLNGALQYLIRREMLPYTFLKTPNRLLFDYMGATTEEEKQLLSAIVRDANPAFMRWALKALVNWQRTSSPEQIIHIHGTKDKILKPDFIKADHWIEGGTHMMIYNRASEISALISQYLD